MGTNPLEEDPINKIQLQLMTAYDQWYVNYVIPEFLICFEAWAKLAQQQLVCAPLGIHQEPTMSQ